MRCSFKSQIFPENPLSLPDQLPITHYPLPITKMSHFNLKSLMFYGVAIGSVVVLFKFVTAWGESNLKASPPIGGRYTINAKNLPGCLKTEALLLEIQQSGIYLNGSLLPTNNAVDSQTIVKEKPSLIGKFSQQKLSMSGVVSHLTSCQNQSLRLQGIVDGNTLKGQINLSSIPNAVNFTAQKEATAQKTETKSH